MERWTVKELARLSGVSVRTLHHYDAVGLLRPACVGENGYRYYGREELLRLQQILLHRELALPLAQIAQLLDAPGFDRAKALRAHRQTLVAEAARYRRLVRTIDQTLAALEGETDMDEKDLYRGFAPEKQAGYEDWLVGRYGPGMREEIAASKAKLKGASAADMARLQADAEAIEAGMAKALEEGLPADSSPVQALMRRHHDWVAAFWRKPPAPEAFAGLGRLYQEHPDFRARYDGRAAGLTDYLAEAMRVFAESEL